ncbi:Rrf2 family transcriptional regulator [Patescibacteria group bacterium]|nr:Rrf2 family transcriptional regulator [Patescibacteria group bacterium]
MFKISTKSDYALIIMMELAKNANLGYLSLSIIAKKMQISASYLTQIAQPLIKANLIESREGKMGGLKLAKSAKKISVLDIMEAIENTGQLKCFQVGKRTCPNIKLCGVKKAWLSIITNMKEVLIKEKLSDLI